MPLCQNIRPLGHLASLLAILALAAACLTGASGGTAQADTSPGNAALDWAEGHALGDPYVWGGAGPDGYDCSGTVYAAFRAEGIMLPRTTEGMLASPLLVRTYSPQRGDLAFWGPVGAPYHVEFVTIWHDATFGALDTGTLVGWHTYYPQYWAPSAFYRVVR